MQVHPWYPTKDVLDSIFEGARPLAVVLGAWSPCAKYSAMHARLIVATRLPRREQVRYEAAGESAGDVRRDPGRRVIEHRSRGLRPRRERSWSTGRQGSDDGLVRQKRNPVDVRSRMRRAGPCVSRSLTLRMTGLNASSSGSQSPTSAPDVAVMPGWPACHKGAVLNGASISASATDRSRSPRTSSSAHAGVGSWRSALPKDGSDAAGFGLLTRGLRRCFTLEATKVSS
jgi:hypothetical protein